MLNGLALSRRPWPHAGLGFDINGVEIFFSGGQTTELSFQFSVKYVLRNGNQPF